MGDKVKECSCGNNHFHQMNDYPMGATVVLLRRIPERNHKLHIGLVGYVVGHCEDGRAVVEFGDNKTGHTFHFPDKCIAVAYPDAENKSTKQIVSEVSP